MAEQNREQKQGKFKKPLVLIVVIAPLLLGAVAAIYVFFPSVFSSFPGQKVKTSSSDYVPSWEENKGVYAFECPADSKQVIVPKDYQTISEAIENSTYGTIIKVKEGTYQGSITLKPGICLEAEGDVLLQGTTKGPVITAADKTKISGFKFQTPISEDNVDDWHKASAIYATDRALVNVEANSFVGCHIAISSEKAAKIYIQDNTINCQDKPYGLALTYSSALVRNNSVSNCGFPEYYYGVSGEVSGETISDGTNGITTYKKSNLKIHDNTFRNIEYAAINYSQTGSDTLKNNTYQNVGKEEITNEIE